MTEYSNPRKTVVISDWPNGRTNKVTATFTVEANKKGERAIRQTTGKPKALTYDEKCCFVDGDDGKLYVLRLAQYYQMITVSKGTFDYNHETVHMSSSPERYKTLLALLNSVEVLT